MTQKTQIVTIHKRLRPLRFAFLVRPNDLSTLNRIFEINTCLWGGRFNGIIPVYQKTPSSWTQRPMRAPAARDIVEGYLDAFEPDFVVTPDEALSKGFPIPKARLLALKDILNPEAESPIGYGLNVNEIYSDLYTRIFQFQRRQKANFHLAATRQRKMQFFISACFGAFPKETKLKYFKENYKDVFEAKETNVEPSNFFRTFRSEWHPLNVGSYGASSFQYRIEEPTLFYMDVTSGLDLIDFWNLRAIGWRRLVPLPKQWASQLIDESSEFIVRNHKPWRHNKDMMHRTTLLQSRSSTHGEIEAFSRGLKKETGGAITFQHWYPRIWDEWAREKDRVQRCTVTVKEGDDDITISNGQVGFQCISPDFADKSLGQPSTPRWANVVEIRGSSFSYDLAHVLPAGIPELDKALGLMSFALGDRRWTSREGIVQACERTDWKENLLLPPPMEVFRAWARNKGFDLVISGAGNIAAQVIRALDGRFGIELLRSKELIELLNKMAHTQIEVPLLDGDNPSKAKVRAATVPKEQLWKTLMKICDNRESFVRGRLEGLIKCGVLRVGLRLQCPQCSQHTWFGLGKLTESLLCERCQQEFPFPSQDPPKASWHYRSIGPFAIENYAMGSYCIVLALRFFSELSSGRGVTWVPPFSLKTHGKELETDIGVFIRSSRLDSTEQTLILGECKTNDRFKKKDLNRMRALAKAVPGAVIAFCTLRDQLESSEKRLIASLANQGRRHWRAGKWFNPVLVLTGTELFSDRPIPFCWKDKGGRYAPFDNFYHSEGFQDLCDVTQQLYLDMEPYMSWAEKKRMSRSAKGLKQILAKAPVANPLSSLSKAAQHAEILSQELQKPNDIESNVKKEEDVNQSNGVSPPPAKN
jgi:hypothetical protein